MIYLTSNDLIIINKFVIANANEPYLGIEFKDGLSLVINQPKISIFGEELYPSIWLKSAYIMQKITKKHIFKDGNKRTAYIATKLFLLLNDFHLKLTSKQLINMVINVTTKRDTKKEMMNLAKYLKKHSQYFGYVAYH